MLLNAMLNAAWHGLALALFAALALPLMPRPSSAFRYAVWWATLVVVAADTLVEVALVYRPAAAALAPAPASWVVVPRAPLATPSLTALGWAAGALVAFVWTWIGCSRLQRLKRRTWPVPAPRLDRFVWAARVRAHARRRGRVRFSADVPGAAVLGGRHPVVALAPLLAERVSDDDLDRVLVHEHSHIDRSDDWALLAEQAITALCWWHPGVWLARRRIAFEREAACDERVVSVVGDAREYAACLLRVRAAMAAAPAPVLAPAVFASRSQLGARVRRLVRLEAAPRLRSTPATWLVASCVLAGAMVWVGQTSVAFVAALDPPRAWRVAEAPVPSVRTPTVAEVARLTPRALDAVPEPIVAAPRAAARGPRQTAPARARTVDPPPVRALSLAVSTDAPTISGVAAALASPSPDPLAASGRTPPGDGSAAPGGIDRDAAGVGSAFAKVGTTTASAFAHAGKSTAGFFKRMSLSISKGVSHR